jgi:hypothetical protein
MHSGNTIEFPEDFQYLGRKCAVVDAYSSVENPGPRGMGIMLVMEVFRSEMDFARENGSGELFKMLKQARHYPYSDLDREPVI